MRRTLLLCIRNEESHQDKSRSVNLEQSSRVQSFETGLEGKKSTYSKQKKKEDCIKVINFENKTNKTA